ncbi:MAG: HAD-IC family P-type ATPase, partial [Burkholderiales bacterium]|nr:HAD-IC family P-type ATPase [Burkholderiales bacterium]
MNFTRLKELFASFLQTRHIGRHFRRFILLDTLARTSIARDVPAELSQTLLRSSFSEPSLMISELSSHQDGLTNEQVEVIRKRIGLNEIEHEKPLSWGVHLWHCYRNPFNLLLSLLALVSYLTEDIKASIVIGTMIVMSTLLRFWQEGKSNQAADALKAMVSNTATVLRRESMHDANSASQLLGPNTTRQELAITLLVPGDLILLSAGDMIPADCRILMAKDLFVSQAAMTGESMPVEKFPEQKDRNAINPLDLDNILYMGTNVVSGSATAIIFATGNQTYFGTLASRVTATDRAPTSFQSGVNKVSWLLIRFMLVMSPLVLFINGVTKGDWMEALLFALSIAVGLTPEMLPMIVTSTLAKGAVFLSRKKIIVKRLDAIQNFGAMDILCTDKTGTLTQDKIFLARHV